MVNVGNFGGCCGARLLTGWYDDISTKEIEKLCSEVRGIALVILNDSQVPKVEKKLLDCGFKILVDGFHNPVHPEMPGLTLYGYLSDPKRLRPRTMEKDELYRIGYPVDERFKEDARLRAVHYFRQEPYENVKFEKEVKEKLTKANEAVINKIKTLRGRKRKE